MGVKVTHETVVQAGARAQEHQQFWRAVCSCGFKGLYRSTSAGAEESARMHRAITEHCCLETTTCSKCGGGVCEQCAVKWDEGGEHNRTTVRAICEDCK